MLTIIGTESRLFLSLKTIATLSLLFFLTACSIPTREFSAYNNAFAETQKIGEQIVIDYSVAKKELAVLKRGKDEQAVRKSSFKSNQLLLSKVPIDDVAIRLAAWEVVGSYNKVLSNLIAGKPAQAESESKNILSSLLRLSAKALSTTASKLHPAAAALKAILAEVEKGLERRRIIKSMERISPIISNGLIANMKKDSELFYKVRYGLNNHRYQQLRFDIGRHIKAFVKLANIMSVEARIDTVYPMVKTLNARMEKIAKSSTGRGFKPIKLRPKAGGSNGPIIISQLNTLKMQILILLDQAAQQNQALESYRETLTAYVRLLNQLDLHLKALQQAATDGRSEQIELSNDFNTALIQMRQAHLYYQNSQ